MASFTRNLSSEYRKIQAKTIDIDFTNDGLVGIHDIIRSEVGAKDLQSEVCYREGKRNSPSMQELDSLDEADLDTDRDWSWVDRDKVVVITGGTGGIGADIAKHLAGLGVKKLVLMGLQTMPLRDQWESVLSKKEGPQGIARKVRLFQELEQQGVVLEYFGGRLTEQVALTMFFTQIRDKFGPIGGVIHCAGTVSEENPAFINKNNKEIERVLEPKTSGLEALHSILAIDRPDFFILFSSVSGLFPALATGISDYGAANTIMDYFVAFQHTNGFSYYKSINWPVWSEGGMPNLDSPIYNKLGLTSHTNAEGISMLNRVMGIKQEKSMAPCFIDRSMFTRELLLTTRQEGERSARLKLPTDKPSIRIENTLIATIVQSLKKIFSDELKIPEEQLDEEISFSDYGVDSILLVDLINRVEEWLGKKIEPTIFFEYTTLRTLAEYLGEKYYDVFASIIEQPSHDAAAQSISNEKQTAGENNSGKIAVIGMAANFPGANNLALFWENLKNGKSSITEIPPARWEINQFYSPKHQNGKSISKWGGFIENVEDFDPEYFKISESDAPYIDPMIRQFLEISAQTLKDAGYQDAELENRKVGVYAAARSGTFNSRINQVQKNTIVGIGQNFIAAYVSHFFNFKGASLVIDTACSSALTSIHMACQSLAAGEIDYAIAGGVEILLDEKNYLLLSAARALSPDGKCFTFDEKANGFVPGEGCGAVLLKPLEKAIADGDRIYAVIESSAMNNDGRTLGITTPNPEMQCAVIEEALSRGNINPDSVSFIETHGTGTMIGDPIELRALTNVFRKWTDRVGFCGVGSVKTNIGHLLLASGMASFIKMALSVYHRQLPPTLNCDVPNPRFEFGSSPFYPNTELKTWDPAYGVCRAGISSFGFGGTNVHVILSNFEPDFISAYQPHRNSLPLVDFKRKRYWPESKIQDAKITHTAFEVDKLAHEYSDSFLDFREESAE